MGKRPKFIKLSDFFKFYKNSALYLNRPLKEIGKDLKLARLLDFFKVFAIFRLAVKQIHFSSLALNLRYFSSTLVLMGT